MTEESQRTSSIGAALPQLSEPNKPGKKKKKKEKRVTDVSIS